jgi:drug/metabolite transporter (DMT)-like permease
MLRLLLILPGIYLLTQTRVNEVDLLGVVMMLGSSALYALHIPINQRVLYDMPAPTVTFYTLLAMSAVVLPSLLFSGVVSSLAFVPITGWLALLGITIVTFFSRLTLFMGVKSLGGMQTALLGLSELLVTIFFSHIWLHERLNTLQWLGAFLLVCSLLLISLDKSKPSPRHASFWLAWLRPPGLPKDMPWPPHDI